jgi:hypothetical protein
MKNAVFWDVAADTCSRWFLARGFFYPEDGGDMFLRNVGSHKIYTAPHPRRLHFSILLLVSNYKITCLDNFSAVSSKRLKTLF